MIEERTYGGRVKAQYVWSAAGPHALILRDRFADGAPIGDLEVPVESRFGFERLYAQQDAEGNVTSVADVDGGVRERYAYDAGGVPQALKPGFTPYAVSEDGAGRPQYSGNALPVESTRWSWEYFYRGMRWRQLTPESSPTVSPGGVYAAGGGSWYNPYQGRTLQPDPFAAASAARNAYDPVPLSWRVTMGALEGALLAVRVGSYFVPGAGIFVGTLTNAFLNGADRSRRGQGTMDAVNGGLFDATGISGLYGAFTDRDVVTQEELHLTTGGKWLAGAGGALSFLAVGSAFSKGFAALAEGGGGARPWPPRPPEAGRSPRLARWRQREVAGSGLPPRWAP